MRPVTHDIPVYIWRKNLRSSVTIECIGPGRNATVLFRATITGSDIEVVGPHELAVQAVVSVDFGAETTYETVMYVPRAGRLKVTASNPLIVPRAYVSFNVFGDFPLGSPCELHDLHRYVEIREPEVGRPSETICVSRVF